MFDNMVENLKQFANLLNLLNFLTILGMFMPTAGQFMGQRPVSVQPMMQNFQGYPNYREAIGQPTFCAFMPTDNSQFPAYYEQTTTLAPTRGQSPGTWNRKKGDNNGIEDEKEEINSKFNLMFLKWLKLWNTKH